MDHVMRVLCGLLFLLLTAPAMAQSPYATPPYSTPGVSNLPAQAASITASQPASSVLAAPAGSAGVPTFRQLTGADISGIVASYNGRSGAVTGVSSDVTNALGFTPYSAANPSGYQTAANVTTTLAAPPAIGGTTPAAGTFTGLSLNSNINNRWVSFNNTASAGSGTTRWSMGQNANTENDVTLNTSASQSAAGPTLTFSSTTGVSVGMLVSGTGTNNYSVVSLTSTTVTLSANTTTAVASGSAMFFHANSGNDFIWNSSDDNGAYLLTPLTIIRATGTVRATTLLANLSVTPTIISTGGQGGYLGWNTSGGSGATDFVNNRGGGGGGFNFWNNTVSTAPNIIASLDGSGNFSATSLTVTGNINSTGFANRSSLDNQASAGTTQATATALTKQVTRATTCSTGGFLLPAGAAAGSSTDIIFLNRSGAACTVYPPTGGSIEGGAANASVSIASGADASFRSMSTTAWYQ